VDEREDDSYRPCLSLGDHPNRPLPGRCVVNTLQGRAGSI
jgi:hypothetical protein